MSDESAHSTIRRAARAPESWERGRMVSLTHAEALGLLATVPTGRIAPAERALRTTRHVSHSLVDGMIVIRPLNGTALPMALPDHSTPRTVVSYEAETLDAEARSGWRVTVTGSARVLTPDDLDDVGLARYASALRSDVETTHTVLVEPEIVTGIRLFSDS